MKDHQKEIIENYVNSYNNFDVDGMLKDLHEHLVFENVSGEKVDLRTDGITAFKQQAKAAKGYFRQRKQTITSWEFKKQKVEIAIHYKAVLAVDLPNGLKSGDTLVMKGTSEFEFEDGKIKLIRDKS